MSASEPDFEDREQYMQTTTQSDNEMIHSQEPISDDLETDSSLHSMTLDSARKPADIPVEKYPDPSGRCIISCSRKSDRNMIRCISCMMRAHCTCVGEKADYQGVWSCFLCRNSSSKINFLVNQISSLKHEFLSKLKICEKKYTEINLELQNLRETNSDLVLQLQNSHKEIQRLKSKDDNTTPAIQTSTKSLVIGDSILRDFEATDANKLEVRSLSGATFISIKDTLKLYESDNKSQRYDNIYIIAGTHFDYCLTVWGNSSKQNLSSIQKLQNRAARAITGNYDFTTSESGLIKQLSWMNIHQRLSYFLGILVFKCLNNQAPTYLTEC